MGPENQNNQPIEDDNKEQPIEGNGSDKIFSRADLSKMVNEQVANKLDKQQAEFEKRLQEAVAKAKQDGKDEANMTAKELAEKQEKEHQEALDRQKAELDKRLADLDRRERLAQTREALANAKLPTDAAGMLMGKDEEETKANIETYQRLVDQAVKNQLHLDSSQQTPQAGSNSQPVETPKKDLAEMNYEEMQKFLESQQN